MTFAEQIRFSFPRKIRYGCPHCGCLLVNTLRLAGTRDICPKLRPSTSGARLRFAGRTATAKDNTKSAKNVATATFKSRG